MEKYLKLETLSVGSSGTSVIKVKHLNNNQIFALKKLPIDSKRLFNAKKNVKNFKKLYNNEHESKHDFKDSIDNTCFEEKTKVENDSNYNSSSEDAISKQINEVKILQKLNHPNIVKYYESFFYKNFFCIVMEYADNGDLAKYLKEKKMNNEYLKEELIMEILKQLSEGLKYLHRSKVLHRDIKPHNIFMFNDGIIKIGDFGISKALAHTMDFAESSTGTPYFLSPEICLGQKYNFKSDIWMLGCTLYELTTLTRPFESNTLINLMKVILTKNIDFNLIDELGYSKKLSDLIRCMLKRDPNERPLASEIIEIYNNNLLNSNIHISNLLEKCNKIIKEQENYYTIDSRNNINTLETDHGDTKDKDKYNYNNNDASRMIKIENANKVDDFDSESCNKKTIMNVQRKFSLVQLSEGVLMNKTIKYSNQDKESACIMLKKDQVDCSNKNTYHTNDLISITGLDKNNRQINYKSNKSYDKLVNDDFNSCLTDRNKETPNITSTNTVIKSNVKNDSLIKFYQLKSKSKDKNKLNEFNKSKYEVIKDNSSLIKVESASNFTENNKIYNKNESRTLNNEKNSSIVCVTSQSNSRNKKRFNEENQSNEQHCSPFNLTELNIQDEDAKNRLASMMKYKTIDNKDYLTNSNSNQHDIKYNSFEPSKEIKHKGVVRKFSKVQIFNKQTNESKPVTQLNTEKDKDKERDVFSNHKLNSANNNNSINNAKFNNEYNNIGNLSQFSINTTKESEKNNTFTYKTDNYITNSKINNNGTNNVRRKMSFSTQSGVNKINFIRIKDFDIINQSKNSNIRLKERSNSFIGISKFNNQADLSLFLNNINKSNSNQKNANLNSNLYKDYSSFTNFTNFKIDDSSVNCSNSNCSSIGIGISNFTNMNSSNKPTKIKNMINKLQKKKLILNIENSSEKEDSARIDNITKQSKYDKLLNQTKSNKSKNLKNPPKFPRLPQTTKPTTINVNYDSQPTNTTTTVNYNSKNCKNIKTTVNYNDENVNNHNHLRFDFFNDNKSKNTLKDANANIQNSSIKINQTAKSNIDTINEISKISKSKDIINLATSNSKENNYNNQSSNLLKSEESPILNLKKTKRLNIKPYSPCKIEDLNFDRKIMKQLNNNSTELTHDHLIEKQPHIHIRNSNSKLTKNNTSFEMNYNKKHDNNNKSAYFNFNIFNTSNNKSQEIKDLSSLIMENMNYTPKKSKQYDKQFNMYKKINHIENSENKLFFNRENNHLANYYNSEKITFKDNDLLFRDTDNDNNKYDNALVNNSPNNEIEAVDTSKDNSYNDENKTKNNAYSNNNNLELLSSKIKKMKKDKGKYITFGKTENNEEDNFFKSKGKEISTKEEKININKLNLNKEINMKGVKNSLLPKSKISNKYRYDAASPD